VRKKIRYLLIIFTGDITEGSKKYETQIYKGLEGIKADGF